MRMETEVEKEMEVEKDVEEEVEEDVRMYVFSHVSETNCTKKLRNYSKSDTLDIDDYIIFIYFD